MNLAAMTPQNKLSSTGYCLAHAGKDRSEYLIYLPDGGKVTVDLAGSSGMLAAEWFNPTTGETVAGKPAEAGDKRDFTAPFSGDAVLYLARRP